MFPKICLGHVDHDKILKTGGHYIWHQISDMTSGVTTMIRDGHKIVINKRAHSVSVNVILFRVQPLIYNPQKSDFCRENKKQ